MTIDFTPEPVARTGTILQNLEDVPKRRILKFRSNASGFLPSLHRVWGDPFHLSGQPGADHRCVVALSEAPWE